MNEGGMNEWMRVKMKEQSKGATNKLHNRYKTIKKPNS